MKSGDRRFRDRGRRPQTAQDVVGPGINQQATEATNVLSQRRQRVTDAATQGKPTQSRQRGRTRETDMNGNVEVVRIEFLQPGENGGRSRSRIAK
jgi:hypothetical protein